MNSIYSQVIDQVYDQVYNQVKDQIIVKVNKRIRFSIYNVIDIPQLTIQQELLIESITTQLRKN